jgi:hypothetical protein
MTVRRIFLQTTKLAIAFGCFGLLFGTGAARAQMMMPMMPMPSAMHPLMHHHRHHHPGTVEIGGFFVPMHVVQRYGGEAALRSLFKHDPKKFDHLMTSLHVPR